MACTSGKTSRRREAALALTTSAWHPSALRELRATCCPHLGAEAGRTRACWRGRRTSHQADFTGTGRWRHVRLAGRDSGDQAEEGRDSARGLSTVASPHCGPLVWQARLSYRGQPPEWTVHPSPWPSLPTPGFSVPRSVLTSSLAPVPSRQTTCCCRQCQSPLLATLWGAVTQGAHDCCP